MRVIQTICVLWDHMHSVIGYQWQLDVSVYSVLAANFLFILCYFLVFLIRLRSFSWLVLQTLLSLASALKHTGKRAVKLGTELHWICIAEVNTHTPSQRNWATFAHRWNAHKCWRWKEGMALKVIVSVDSALLLQSSSECKSSEVASSCGNRGNSLYKLCSGFKYSVSPIQHLLTRK